MSSLRSPVELRLGEKSRSLAQDLIRPPELAVLPLQLLHPGPLVTRQAPAPAGVDLLPAHPLPQRLRGAADLTCDRYDRRPLRSVLPLVL